MIKLNDYLYSGDTVIKILYKYMENLKKSARQTNNPVDLMHSNFLLQMANLLEHNDFLTSQSQRLREFYQFMVNEYPYLAFALKAG